MTTQPDIDRMRLAILGRQTDRPILPWVTDVYAQGYWADAAAPGSVEKRYRVHATLDEAALRRWGLSLADVLHPYEPGGAADTLMWGCAVRVEVSDYSGFGSGQKATWTTASDTIVQDGAASLLAVQSGMQEDLFGDPTFANVGDSARALRRLEEGPILLTQVGSLATLAVPSGEYLDGDSRLIQLTPWPAWLGQYEGIGEYGPPFPPGVDLPEWAVMWAPRQVPVSWPALGPGA